MKVTYFFLAGYSSSLDVVVMDINVEKNQWILPIIFHHTSSKMQKKNIIMLLFLVR